MALESAKTGTDIARYIDHTLLKAEATREEIVRACDEARAWGFHAVCVNGRWVPVAAERLFGTKVKVSGVVGFPLGADTTKVKVAGVREAIDAGADEIDMVADLAAIIEADASYLLYQLRSVLRECRAMRPPVLLKVIIESAALTREQKVFACQIAQQAGVDFIKTSTGLHKETAPACKVKASGGIKTVQQAMEMLEAGADRIGTSAGVKIMEELEATRK
jgi:deoxyribose-phosphate aldolase